MSLKEMLMLMFSMIISTHSKIKDSISTKTPPKFRIKITIMIITRIITKSRTIIINKLKLITIIIKLVMIIMLI